MLETRGLRNLFYITALPLLLIALPRLAARELLASGLFRLVLLYAAYCLLAALWSENLSLAGFADLLRVTLLALLFYTACSLFAQRLPTFELRFFQAFALSAGLSAAALFIAAAAGFHNYKIRLGGFGLAEHPVIGATLYGFALLAAAFVLLPRAKSWPERLLWLAVVCLAAAFMMLTGSRGPLLALAAAVAVGLALADRRLAITLVVLFGAGLTIGLLADTLPILRITAGQSSGHLTVWPQALEAAVARPWFGYGSLADFAFTTTNKPSRSAHNLLLSNQLYGGLPASLLLFALLGLALWHAFRLRNAGKEIYLMLLVFGLTASLFDSRSLLQNLGREWVTLWLPLALVTAGGLRRPEIPDGAASNPLRQ